MGRFTKSKKSNIVNKIGKAAELHKASEIRKLSYEWNSEPGTELIFILENDSPELSDQELEIIQSMGDGVYFNPRPRKQTIIQSENLKKWQCLNFESYKEYCGWLSFNNQVGGATETDLMSNIKDNNVATEY